MTLTRRLALLGALATPSVARAAAPSWPECTRKPLCNFVQVSRSQDLTRCEPPPRDRRGQVLTQGGLCWQPIRAEWRCAVCGKVERKVE
jgi:hypothetical protein